MKEAKRWLLPDGIEEMLPQEAAQVESLRRRLVNLFQRWGYDYVIPPMLEFTDSLLTGAGQDISLLTFKVTDQLSGKMLGLRADFTPQVARMDAHSLNREGVNRLCYAGHVAYTRAKGPLRSRTPIQVGVELFGEAGIDADIEVISLLLNTLEEAGLPEQYLDLGHVGIYRCLSRLAGFNAQQEVALFELLQVKAITEMKEWLAANVADDTIRAWLLALPGLSGGVEILDTAAEIFAGAPEAVCECVRELRAVSVELQNRFPTSQLYFDLSELRGYHYLTGIVFGAFAPGVGTSIASGGRYNHVGEAFGRSRPATGFSVDLTELRSLATFGDATGRVAGIFAPNSIVDGFWVKVKSLRDAGERVICGHSGQSLPAEHQYCDRILVEDNGSFSVKKLGQ